MRSASLIALLALAAVPAAAAEPARDKICYPPHETREKIAKLGLVEPLRLLKTNAGRLQAEVVAARLCRSHEDWVYEVSLLRRDGRLVHLVLNAASGQTIGSRGE